MCFRIVFLLRQSPSASASSVIDCFILKWALSLLCNDVRHAPWYFSSCATTSALYFAKSFWSCKFCAHWWSLVLRCIVIASRSLERDACFSQMKHSSRCNDRSSVGAVKLFLVNLNDDGTSERLVSVGWCLFWTLWSFVLLNISLHDSWYFACFVFFYKSSLYSISFGDSTYIERNWHFVDLGKLGNIFWQGSVSWFCQINFHWRWFECLMLVFLANKTLRPICALLLLSRQRKPNSFRHSNQ